ncbi:MFS transporter (plasmid) [Streptomyces sp. BB1-1-1]|uniref:MFS transporter n=1 Tax=Streptomyces sp. BB1-1-1 TaxID=3074430 RepID=UPI00287766BB|nr:MFS transporter [Streptomyces sp. BB1-1-1]WND32858.1 MFS transporter [Streptomyces sp. BB1-1-1]WND40073.1 MFS transporter [Streptomyces sp. BB1-1-1]WND40908.1 MFS transporter [Streptomyces sp. BB1-1-1]
MALQSSSPAGQLSRARRSVSGYFFINGVAFSSWVARIPDIKERLGLSDGLLGAALLVAAVGTVLGLASVGRYVDQLSADSVSRWASAAVSIGLVGPGLAPNLTVLMASLMFFGLAGGAYNVSMNAQAVAVDRAYGRQIITSFHAAYSVGGLLGSALGSLAVRLDVAPAVSFPVLAGALMAGALACGRGQVRTAAFGQPPAPGGARQRVRRLDGRLMLLGACCFACLLAEGAIADWSGVYLREDVALSAALAPTGYMFFSVAMASGRLVADRLAASIGAKRLVTCSALLASGGLCTGLLSNQGTAAVIGFGVFGAGLACVMPQMFKVAGNLFPHETGRAVAAVATLGYAGLLSGPPLIGLLAHLLGLPTALGLLVLLMLFVALASRIITTWSSKDSRPAERPSG